jgi:hypothetical protein
MFDMRRCEFIPLLGGAAVYPPPPARAQQLERTVLLHALVENDPEAQVPVVAFRQAFEAHPAFLRRTGDVKLSTKSFL